MVHRTSFLHPQIFYNWSIIFRETISVAIKRQRQVYALKLKKKKIRGFSPQANYTERSPPVSEASANFSA
jgi:hypothetical protein